VTLLEVLEPETPQQLKAEDIWPFRDKITGEVITDPDFDQYMEWMHDLEFKRQLLAGLNMPRSFVPRPYQVEGAVWLRSGVPTNTKNFSDPDSIPLRSCKMLYDLPGLGKTLQAAMAMTVPAIVTCPGYLVQQWADFFADQYPQWKVAAITQGLLRTERQALLDDPSYDIWVINHEMWAARKEPFKGGKEPQMYYRNGKPNPDYSYEAWHKWYEAKEEHESLSKRKSFHFPRVRTLVIDESHHMRNRDASQTVGCSNFADTCDYVFLLTGTPQYKDVRDWWNQLRIMDPLKFRSYRQWEYHYCYARTPTIYMVNPQRAAALRDEIAPYAMGRTYKDVGLYLPDLIENTVKVNWHPDLRKAYNQLKQSMRIQTDDGNSLAINLASLLHTLRLFTGCPEKIDAVKQIVKDIPGDKPIILFCWYRDAAELLAEEFALLPSSIKITGEFTQKERLNRASQPDSRVKCVTMAAASEGVDWSDASTVIFFEEDYVPGKLYQALSRVRRWNKEEREDPVIVYYVHMLNSVDEAVHAAVVERNGDIRKILRRALK
jgi:SNF2 family DNA or RNA helicase